MPAGISLRRAVLEVGPYMQYSCHAVMTASSSLKSACAKPVLPFPGAEMFFSACFVCSQLLHVMQMQRSFEA